MGGLPDSFSKCYHVMMPTTHHLLFFVVACLLACLPDHVGRVDVLDVADLVLIVELLLDDPLHELADRRQTLVPFSTTINRLNDSVHMYVCMYTKNKLMGFKL